MAKAVRSIYTKKADEKLTPDEVKVLVRGLMEESVSKLIVIARWAFVFGAVGLVVSLVSLVLVLRVR